MDERQPTVREIARRSGFGKSTVSLALRDDHRLPLQTRQRIQAVAHELGYRPNPYVSSLMTHWRRTRTMKTGATLGLLSLRHDTLIPPPGSILARYLEGIHGRAQELGYSVDELWLRAPGMTSRRMNGILRSRQIRAVIVIPLPEDQGVVDLDWSPLAAATMGYSVSNRGMPRACFNNVQGVTVLLERMHELGYRRVGLAMKHSHDERTNHLWLAGYLAFQHLRVAERNRLSPLLIDDWRDDGFRRWLNSSRPDAILSPYEGMPEMLGKLGLRVPEDIGFGSLDRSPDDHAVAGLDQSYERIGSTAVDLVVSHLQRNEYGPLEAPNLTLVTGRWVSGDTLIQQPSAKKKQARGR